MSKNLKKQWRVQVRRSRKHAWRNKGLFETRSAARTNAWMYREVNGGSVGIDRQPVGFGNTRVVGYSKGQK